jgi:hypothetical protein
VRAWVSDRATVLSPGTVRLLVALLRSIFAAAVQDRLVASSPVTRLSLPRSEGERIVPFQQFGGPGAIRTRDTRFRRAVLYPLSYGAIWSRVPVGS